MPRLATGIRALARPLVLERHRQGSHEPMPPRPHTCRSLHSSSISSVVRVPSGLCAARSKYRSILVHTNVDYGNAKRPEDV